MIVEDVPVERTLVERHEPGKLRPPIFGGGDDSYSD